MPAYSRFLNPAPRTADGCYHCGLPVPSGKRFTVMVDGADRAMCCAGCQAVAQTIVANHLTAYYRYRSALPLPEQSTLPRISGECAFAIPEIEAAAAQPAGAHSREAELMLVGITCPACVWLIEQRIRRLPGIVGIDINYATQRARVRWDTNGTRLATILQAVAALGYDAYPCDTAAASGARQAERRRALTRLFVAGMGMMQVMMYLVPLYVTEGEMTADIEQLMRVASMILTLPVVCYSALPFFVGAWRDLRTRHLGMDVPVALGIAAAFAASAYATLKGAGAVYFDSITMFIFLLLGARYLEMSARMRAALRQEQLAHSVPAVAERFVSWPASDIAELVAAASLHEGDFVRVRAGAIVPVDGIVVEGASELDERLLTGEAVPRPKRIGDAVVGGSCNVANPLIMQATRVGDATVVAGVRRLLDRGASEKPRIARSADRVARHFVLALLAIVAIVAVAWYGIDPARALAVTLAVLVVSCPCALSLATPAALTVASGALHAQGVLVTHGDAIEHLAQATDYVFDKTGTLTTGEMRLVGVIPIKPAADQYACALCLSWAQALAADSAHPIARALTAGAQPGLRAQAVKNIAGSGIEGVVQGVRMRLGKPQFVAELHGQAMPQELAFIADDVSVIALGDQRGWVALLAFEDPLREYARFLVHELRRMGKRVHLLSGDRHEVVARVAAELGIEHVRAAASPEDKLEYVRLLQREGAIVAMVGDGVNDAACLAAAQVSVAMGGGADLACASGDLVLLSERLDRLLAAVVAARATLRVIKQNLVWAFAYNMVAIPLAAFGLVTPLIAGAGMAASSTLVVANAVRLTRSRQQDATGAAPSFA